MNHSKGTTCKNRGTLKGFSLVETLLAMTVIVIAFLTILAAMNKGFKTSTDARDEIIAANLAQEGVELVRHVRDETWIDENAADGQSFKHFPTGTCRVDAAGKFPTMSSVDCGAGYQLGLTPAGQYVHNGGQPTKFYRKVEINVIDANERYEVKSFVSWKGDGSFPANCTGAAAKCIVARAVLTNWYEKTP